MVDLNTTTTTTFNNCRWPDVIAVFLGDNELSDNKEQTKPGQDYVVECLLNAKWHPNCVGQALIALKCIIAIDYCVRVSD